MNISDQVRDYLRKNPNIRIAVEMGIVNYSALARKIMKEENIENFDAIISTLKRIPKSEREPTSIKRILKNSKIETVTGLSYIVLKSTTANMRKAVNSLASIIRDYHKYRIVQSVQGIGVIIDDSDLDRFILSIPRTEIIEEMRNIGELIVTSNEDTTYIKGYVAYITNLLASNDINMLQIISFYTDVTVILEIKDVSRAFEVLIKEIS